MIKKQVIYKKNCSKKNKSHEQLPNQFIQRNRVATFYWTEYSFPKCRVLKQKGMEKKIKIMAASNEISLRIVELIQKAWEHVVKTANTTMIYTYYQVGSVIVEEWQDGAERAEYGAKLLQTISSDLTAQFGRGFLFQI